LEREENRICSRGRDGPDREERSAAARLLYVVNAQSGTERRLPGERHELSDVGGRCADRNGGRCRGRAGGVDDGVAVDSCALVCIRGSHVKGEWAACRWRACERATGGEVGSRRLSPARDRESERRESAGGCDRLAIWDVDDT